MPRQASTGVIETANSHTLPVLRSDYVFPAGTSQTVTSPRDGTTYTMTLETSSSIAAVDLQACFDLIEHTSADMYRNSDTRWSPAKKRKEMKLPDMRYLLLRRAALVDMSCSLSARDAAPAHARARADVRREESAAVHGFISFMATYEDGHEVIYCYEIHLTERLRGCGLGRILLNAMEDVGKRFGVEKAMLTVYLANSSGLDFYSKCGYTTDDYSPRPSVLRSGKTKEPAYVILSKALAAGPTFVKDASDSAFADRHSPKAYPE